MLPQNPFAYLISFEGLDAVGKTTLANGLFDHLRNTFGSAVQIFPEFSDCPIGKLLVESTKKYNFVRLHQNVQTPFSDTLLLMADLSAKRELLQDYNNERQIVIADRYTHSLIAYQVPRIVKSNPSVQYRDVLRWVTASVNTLFGKPDLTWLINVPLEVVLDRIRSRDSYSPTAEDVEFFKQGQLIFEALAKVNKKRFREVDGTRDIKSILAEMIEEVTTKLAERGLVTSR